MKNIIYASLVILCISCSTGSEKSAKDETPVKTEVAATKEYICPMKCEGEKTYAKAGKCPVCQMDLQEIALAGPDSTVHAH